jgi:hypothetical protein
MKSTIIAFLFPFLVSCYGVTPEKTGLERKPLPSFSLLLTDSSTWVHNSNISTGKPFGIFIFSPFCPHCRAQTEEIIDNIQELKNVPLYFVSSFPLPLLKNYYQEYHLAKYPNIFLGRDTGNVIASYFDIPGIPYMAICGKDHKLKKSFLGKVSSDQIKQVAEE